MVHLRWMVECYQVFYLVMVIFFQQNTINSQSFDAAGGNGGIENLFQWQVRK